MRFFALLMLAILCPFLSIPAGAEECAEKVASFDLAQDSEGDIMIPTFFDNVPGTMGLDFGSGHTALMKRIADQLNLPFKQMGNRYSIVKNGEVISQIMEIPSVAIGKIAGHMTFLILPTQGETNAKLDGWFGLDFLSNFDVEIDFGTKRVNFFRPNHCADGAVVTWTKDYQTLPLTERTMGNFDFPIKLDGRDMRVGFMVSSASHTFMLSQLSNALGLQVKSPGMELLPPMPNSRGFDEYRYPVDSLKFGDIELGPQTITVTDDVSRAACNVRRNCYGAEAGGSLSFNQLKSTHIYIAYRAKKLYISNIDTK